MTPQKTLCVFISLCLLSAGLALFLAPASVNASAIVVNTLTDGAPTPGTCTLRQAIVNANTNSQSGSTGCAVGAGADAITFSVSGTITLTTTLPNIAEDLIISGPNIAISGASSFPILSINSDVTLTLNNLTLRDGNNSGGDGGAVVNNGTLNLNHVVFTNNQAGQLYSGGAIVSYGPLNITNSEFYFNQAGNGGALFPRFAAAPTNISGSYFHENFATSVSNGWGGAMLLWDGAPVTLTNTTLLDNSAWGGGGAIYAFGTTTSLNVISSTLLANLVLPASNGPGGGIYSEGVLTMTSSALEGNTSSDGGALHIRSGTASITATTWYSNAAANGGAVSQVGGVMTLNQNWLHHNGLVNSGAGLVGSFQGGAIRVAGGSAFLNNLTINNNTAGFGGGIDQEGGSATIVNVTLSGNYASYVGGIMQAGGAMTVTNVTLDGNGGLNSAGGLYSQAGTLSLRNTIISNSGPAPNCGAVPMTSTANLSTDGSCGFGGGRDNIVAHLAPLGAYGGPTLTQVPLLGSPAIDFGTNTGCPSTDQRGKPRPYPLAGTCDAGAVERQGVDVSLLYLPLIRR